MKVNDRTQSAALIEVADDFQLYVTQDTPCALKIRNVSELTSNLKVKQVAGNTFIITSK